MRYAIPVLLFLAFCLVGGQAQAKSCSSFVVIKSYDAGAKTAELEYTRGSQSKFFPKPEGANTDTTKIPKKCTKKVTRSTSVKVKPSSFSGERPDSSTGTATKKSGCSTSWRSRAIDDPAAGVSDAGSIRRLEFSPFLDQPLQI